MTSSKNGQGKREQDEMWAAIENAIHCFYNPTNPVSPVGKLIGQI